MQPAAHRSSPRDNSHTISTRFRSEAGAFPGENCRDIADQVPCPDPVHKEEDHAQHHQDAGDHVQPSRFLVVEYRHHQDHKHRCRELQHDRVRRRRQLIRYRIKCGHTDHRQRTGQYAPAENNPVSGDQQVGSDHRRSDQVSRAVDRQCGPWDQLNEKAARAETHGGQENKQD